MEAHLMESGLYGSATPWFTPRAPSICYKVTMTIATTFLLGGGVCAAIGVTNLVRIIGEIQVKVTGGVDIQKMTFNEDVTFTYDKPDLINHTAVTVVGLFLATLSAGILYGMALRRFY